MMESPDAYVTPGLDAPDVVLVAAADVEEEVPITVELVDAEDDT